jgi:hypothetical protein
MRHIKTTRSLLLLLVTVSFSIGCGPGGPDIASVEGVVTLDGKPLPEASVLFINQEGRPAGAWTDKDGKYKLMFDESRSGAIPGQSQIKITTARDGNAAVAGRKESLPDIYNSRTTLSFNVEAKKKNVANFDLKSGGKVDKDQGVN